MLGIPDFDREHRIVLRRLLLGDPVSDAARDLVAELGEDPAEATKVAADIAGELCDAALLQSMLRAR